MRKTFLSAVLAGIFAMGTAMADVPAMKGRSEEGRAELQALIDAALKEGQVVYYDTVIQPETNDELAAAFRTYFGLPASFQVNYSLSGTANLITRMEQEISAGRVSMDVASIAAPNWLFDKVKEGAVLEYQSPEYAHYTEVFDANIGMPGYFAFNGAYVFAPMWNGDNLDFKGTSWRDVIGAIDPGKITIGDATASASHLATFHGLLQELGEEFFTGIAALKPSFLVRSEQLASRLVTGQDQMTLAGQPTRALQNNNRGANLRLLFPKEGVVLMPQNTFIFAKAPHPNAARLWIDFILSEEGQTILSRREALMSGRKGFVSPVPEYAPAMSDVAIINLDWRNLTNEALQKSRDTWVRIFNP